MLQLSGNMSATRPETSSSLETVSPAPRSRTLVDLENGDEAILDRLELPADDARRLMELGFLPGTRVVAGLSAPGGDPRVFRVDGSEVALRRETAAQLHLRSTQPELT